MRRPLLALLTCLLSACQSETPGDESIEPGVFGIDPVPLLTIGASDGDPRLMFHQAHAARRTGDGLVVVADGGSRQLRWYASDGSPVRVAGREGDGPGEFAGSLALIPWAGDTIAAVDRASRRLSLLSATGEFQRSVTEVPTDTSTLPWRPWMQARTVILNAAGPQVRACVGAALGVMPLHPIEDGIRFLWVDDVGRLWLREGTEDVAHWSVWRRDGTLLGTPVLPASFDFLQADREVAIGRIAADDDTERVVLLRISDSRDGGDCLPAGSGAEGAPEPPRNLQIHARNMTTVQELMRVEGASYARAVDPRYISVPETVRFWIYTADPFGWLGGVMDLETGQACLISVGGSGPAVWPNGAMACG